MRLDGVGGCGYLDLMGKHKILIIWTQWVGGGRVGVLWVDGGWCGGVWNPYTPHMLCSRECMDREVFRLR